MRRGLALSIATAAWVVVIQLLTGAAAPAPEYSLASVDVQGLRLPTAHLPAPAVLHMSARDFASSRARLMGRAKAANVIIPVATVTTTTAVAVTTSTTQAVTTTSRPAVTSTTMAPITTAAPTTTSPPPITTTTPPAPSGYFDSAAETDFASRINSVRASAGVAGLAGNADLNNYARWWARHMAESGNFAHSNIGSLLGQWSIVGENIGYGPSVQSVFQALVNSPSHYNNMVEPRFTAVGVGVFVDASGKLWTAHVFGG